MPKFNFSILKCIFWGWKKKTQTLTNKLDVFARTYKPTCKPQKMIILLDEQAKNGSMFEIMRDQFLGKCCKDKKLAIKNEYV